MGFANESWFNFFLGGGIRHMNREGSYHVPIMLEMFKVEEVLDDQRRGAKPFHFEAMWIQNEGVK